MRSGSCAVCWREGGGPPHAGRLELGLLHVLLSGNGDGRVAIPLDEIEGFDYGHGELRLKRRGRPLLHIGNLDGPGVLRDFAHRLATRA